MPQYQEANNIFLKNSPVILKKTARKIGCFPHGYTPQKQGNIITYPILSGLHHHYKAFSLSFYSILHFLCIAEDNYLRLMH